MIGQFYANTTDNTNGDFINGREFTVTSVGSETVGGNAQYFIDCSTAGMNLPDSDFSIDLSGEIISTINLSDIIFYFR